MKRSPTWVSVPGTRAPSGSAMVSRPSIPDQNAATPPGSRTPKLTATNRKGISARYRAGLAWRNEFPHARPGKNTVAIARSGGFRDPVHSKRGPGLAGPLSDRPPHCDEHLGAGRRQLSPPNPHTVTKQVGLPHRRIDGSGISREEGVERKCHGAQPSSSEPGWGE